MINLTALLASFTAPITIKTDPWAMLYMFPLLAAIALIYKATKMRVIFWKRFVRETLVLFASVSAFMIAAIIVINLISWLITS
ncbi:MAG: hypothetical protein ACYSUT_02875 [Planctomycetota bacterium]|jgi:hypothetical protein